MTITADTKLNEILQRYPWLPDEVIKLDERARILNNPVAKLFIKRSTVKGMSEKTGLAPDVIINYLNETIEQHEA